MFSSALSTTADQPTKLDSGRCDPGSEDSKERGKKNPKLKIGLDRWREEGVEGGGRENVVGAFVWPGL